MTWSSYHQRRDVMHAVIALADAHASVTLDEALDAVPGSRDVVGDPIDLVFDLQMHWSRTLAAELERLVGEGAETPEIGVVDAWVAAAARVPGTRRLLDAFADDPRLAAAHAKQDETLALAAGVPALSPALIRRGHEIAETARAAQVLPEVAAPRPRRLLERWWSAVSAA